MSQVLSSDILEAQFGPTELAVLRQDDKTRITCTKTVDSGQILEISVVTFKQAGMSGFPGVHRAVLAGESMGKAFRQAGIEFRRIVRAAYGYDVSERLGQWFGSSQAAKVVDVSILVGPNRLLYAEILEIYSPAVEWPTLTGGPAPEHAAIIRSLDYFLASSSSK